MDQLRPLKAAIELPNPFWGLGQVLLALLVLGLAWWWWRRRSRVQALPIPLPLVEKLQAEEGAKQAMASLMAAGWLEGGAKRKEIEGHAHALAAVLRAWMAARFGWPAPGLTSHELLGLMAHAGLPDGAFPQVESVLMRLDRVRFGDRPASAAVVREAHAGALWLVDALGDASVPVLLPIAWAQRSEREVH